MFTLLLHGLLIISSVVYCEESKDVTIEKDGHVLIFTKDNFKAGLDKHENVLVEFCKYISLSYSVVTCIAAYIHS